MSSFEITGGKRLSGEIVPQGAKNEALQVICATLLTSEKITIRNIPVIHDVVRLIELLKDLGVEVGQEGPSTFTFQAREVRFDYLHTDDFRVKVGSMRGSIMILGPLLGRFGKGYVHLSLIHI